MLSWWVIEKRVLEGANTNPSRNKLKDPAPDAIGRESCFPYEKALVRQRWSRQARIAAGPALEHRDGNYELPEVVPPFSQAWRDRGWMRDTPAAFICAGAKRRSA